MSSSISSVFGFGASAAPNGSDPVPVTTYDLFVGGSFRRSESGRVYPVTGYQGELLANASQASRRDARDAVAAARGATGAWTATSAYTRGQLLYRVAELLAERRERFVADVAAAEGWPPRRAGALVDTAVQRWVWYAGWTDKIATVFGSVNAVAAPTLCVSVPEPAGVAAVLAPQTSALLGLVSVLAPVLATGNTAVVVASQHRPLPAVRLSELLASTELPAGVVNILTGRTAELAPWLAAHPEVDAVDLCGAPAAISIDLARTAAGTLTRVLPTPAAEPDWTRTPDLTRLRTFIEIKTIWGPEGW